MTFTLSWRLDHLVTSEAHGQEKSLGALECVVKQREEEHGPDDLWRKGHFQNSQTQLDVLTACFHRDGPAASGFSTDRSLALTASYVDNDLNDIVHLDVLYF